MNKEELTKAALRLVTLRLFTEVAGQTLETEESNPLEALRSIRVVGTDTKKVFMEFILMTKEELKAEEERLPAEVKERADRMEDDYWRERIEQ